MQAKSEIKFPEKYREGQQKIAWVQKYMPILNVIRREYEQEKPLSGETVSLSIHLEAKTAYLAIVLRDLGARVFVTGCNPLSTQDDVAAALAREENISVFGWHGANEEEYQYALEQVLKAEPDYFIDDGGDLTHLLHGKLKEIGSGIKGGAEETTTGIKRLKAREREGLLNFPMINVNDAYCKHLFDNRYGTGQSVWDAMINNTNLQMSGKTVVVVGYGWCGRGVSMRATGLGARVIICEIDPIKAIEAHMDGYEVMPLKDAAPLGDVFITVTGCIDVIGKEHLSLMRDGVLLANAGHFDVEINKDDLEEIAVEKEEVRENVRAYKTGDGRWLNLLADGRLVNLAGGNGHAAEIMDMSFALQAQSIIYLHREHENLENKLYRVPKDIDHWVALNKLEAMGISIDSLSPEQKTYLEGWE